MTDVPRILVAGLSGGGGKTLVSVGLTAAWVRRGRRVAAFKKGPDYIDAAWLSQAARRPCRNLDLFLMSEEAVTGSLAAAAAGMDVAVIEGNRGLYDGTDAHGTFSSAELAKLLKTPVVLVVDATKCTRTAAALVLGCQRLDPAVPIAAVVLNRTAGSRHVGVLKDAIEGTCGLPVVGALPKLALDPFPERHLGLVPPEERGDTRAAIEAAARAVEEHLKLETLWRIANEAPPLGPTPALPGRAANRGVPGESPGEGALRIAIFRDAAFQFYYPENLEALERAGARLVFVSPLVDAALPEVDALYIGGGFPETLADHLSANEAFRASVRRAVEAGLPVYAECGGAVYLGRELLMGERRYPMCGAMAAVYGFGKRPNGHGYSILRTERPNPFFPVGASLRGHEFHYTFLRSLEAPAATFAFSVRKGHGFDGQRDGLCHRNALASYTHVHALGTPSWAPALVRAAARWRAREPLEVAGAGGSTES